MKGKIQKWGNSLAIRIPRFVAERAGLYDGAEVDLQGQEGRVVIHRPKVDIEELIAQITPETLHGEVDWGPPVGNEIW